MFIVSQFTCDLPPSPDLSPARFSLLSSWLEKDGEYKSWMVCNSRIKLGKYQYFFCVIVHYVV